MGAYKLKVNLIFNEGKMIRPSSSDPTMLNAFYSVSVTGMGNQRGMSPFLLRKEDLAKGEVVGTADYAVAARERLAEVRRQAAEHFGTYANAGTILTPTQIIGYLKGLAAKNSGLMITAVAEDFVQTKCDLKEWSKSLEGKAGSAERLFRSVLKKFQEYLKEKHRAEDYPIQGIDLRMLTQFEIFMRKKEMSEGTVANYIISFMSFFDFMLKQGYLKTDPFVQYNTNKLAAMAEGNAEDLDRKVSKADIIKLKETPLKDPALERYRKIACVQVMTGMAWVDLHLVGDRIREVMTVNLSGMPSIIYNRYKNSNLCIVPVDEELDAAIKDLNYNVNPGTYKTYCGKLTRVFEELGIQVKGKGKTDKFSHCLRHVFGNEMLEKGYSMEAVSRMLGHKSIKMTERVYAKINGEKITADFERVQASARAARERRMQISS